MICFSFFVIIFKSVNGGFSSVAERRVVAPEVRGSNPLSHPMIEIPEQEKELLHKPFITLSSPIMDGREVELTISIGRIPHPMDDNHFIRYIEIYQNDKLVNRVDFDPRIDKEAKTYYSLEWQEGVVIEIRAECNLHGLWKTFISDENKQDFEITAS